MKKHGIVLLILFLSASAICQEKEVRGIVYNEKNNKSLGIKHSPVQGALVEIISTERKTYTDSLGRFTISVPKGNRHLLVSHNDFTSKKVLLAGGGYWIKPITIYLLAQNDSVYMDSLWRKKRNAISYLPMELVIGSIGLQYERFITVKQSVGLNSSFYLFSGYWIIRADTKGNGVKLSPFYRFYPGNIFKNRFFLEGKIMLGYFDFHPLQYDYNSTYGHKFQDVNFWTYGGGISVGWAKRLLKEKNGLLNFSLGFQYFPMQVPEYLNGNHQYTANKDWWYIFGPGSYVQIKLAFGGFF